MNFSATIAYLLALLVTAVALGLVVVWKKNETRKKALYQGLLEQLVALEDFNLTEAVMHAKTYKIMADYRRDSLKLESKQKFILKNIFLIKSTLKTK